MNCYLDSHCHINDKAFKDDLSLILGNMVTNNVLKAMIISSYLDDYQYALNIRHDDICFKHSLGIYPGDVNDIDDQLFAKYAEIYKDDKCDAIGEIGLDYYWQKDNKDRQKQIFIKQLQLAQDLNKPVIIHSRDAIADTYDIMKQFDIKAVMHCYSDSAEMAREFVKLGYYISIAGVVTWKNAKEVLRVIREVPVDRLLIETDCPYLTPAPFRGKRNEPSYVVYVGKKICEELDIDEESFKKQLNENYHNLFGL